MVLVSHVSNGSFLKNLQSWVRVGETKTRKDAKMKISEIIRRLEVFDGNDEVCIDGDECIFAVKDVTHLEDLSVVVMHGGRSLYPGDDSSPEVGYYHNLPDDVRKYCGK